MREILFRGQTRRKGEKARMDGTPVESNWVYGGVLQGTGDHSIIYQTEPDIEKKVVYTDTLGQFTGLTDKNGVKIFEGDIVEYTTGDKSRIGRVFFSDFRASFAVTAGKNGSARINNDLFNYIQNRNCVTVIGNIYDNPELIGSDNYVPANATDINVGGKKDGEQYEK